MLIVPLDEEWLACLEAEAPGAPAYLPERLVNARDRMAEPKKVRNAGPRYPERAIRDRLEGVVEFDAVIGRSGCVHDIS